MIRIKKIYLGIAIVASQFGFAQKNLLSTGFYASPYRNAATVESSKEANTSFINIKESIDLKINQLAYDPVLKNANWGFVIYDPETKKIINSYNETTPFVPASTTKLLTTETAMSVLGGAYHWTTQLEYAGEIDKNGILQGNLYIVGSGDPTLGTGKAGSNTYPRLTAEFISALKENGIKKVNGKIYIQTAVFKDNRQDVLPDKIVWLETRNYYLPVGSSVNINPQNERRIDKSSSIFDKNPRYFYLSPYTHKMVYADAYEPVPLTTKLPDAPAYLARRLKEGMAKSGILVTGGILTKMTEIEPEKRMILSTYQSPTLIEIINDTNHRSDNAVAEALLRVVGFQKAGDQTLESGKMVVKNHLQDIGFDMEGLNYADGSGLSRNNTVTPISQVKYLTYLTNTPYFNDFFDTLPIAGQTGTLRRSFLTGEGNGNIIAKTGTLNRVKTLAGYIKTRTGKTLAFSILINNYNGNISQVKARMESLLNPAVNL